MFKHIEQGNPARHYITTPPQEVVKRNIDNLQVFQQLHYDVIHTPTPKTDKILKANDLNKILKTAFTSHQIHAMYYDDIVDDVLMVKDFLTGKLIPKQNAGLTTDGQFFLPTPSNSITAFGSSEVCFMLLETINPGVFGKSRTEEDLKKSKAFFENKYFKLPQSGLYMLFDPAMFKAGFTFERLQALFRPSANTFFNNFNTEELFYDGSDFTQKMFEDFYSYVMNDRAKNTFNPSDFVHMFYLVVVDDTKPLKDNICLTPKDSKFFPDMAIVFQSLEQRTKYLNDQLAPPTKESYFVEMFGWSRGVSSLAPLPKNYWDRHKMINLDLGLEVGPINFVIEISKKQHNSTSVKTDNNHGIVMGYNQRVPEYKASFVMTEREQEYYKVNKKEVPTFLGIELEYIIKKNKFSNNVPIKIPEQERQALLSPTVKSIADSGFGDHCIMKFDRSVFEKDPTGFEIVTVPATLEYHKKMFDEHFFIKDKRDSKYKPRFPVAVSNACGFHVHIGKDAFLPAGKSEKDRQNKHSATFRLRLGKFIAFMSSPDNLQFIIDLSGRPPNKYCEPNPVKDKNKFGVHNGIGSAKRMTPTSGYDGFARRSIVNTLNSETIEIRIFDATVERNQLFRRLEFCHALVEFVKVCSPKELTVYHFVKFLCDEKLNNKKYETLLHWLSTKKMVGVEKKVSKKHKKSIKVYGPCLVTPPKEVAKDTKGYIERWTNKTNPSAELEEYSRLVRERLRTTINA